MSAAGGLAATGLVRAFGGVRAVDDVSITVRAASIHGLIGPNGSGKTTLLGLLAGTVRLDAGQVTVAGQALRHTGPHRVARHGVARTFQTTRLFADRTVAENFAVGVEERRQARRQRDPWGLERLLDITALTGHAGRTARQLSNAQQRQMMILNALSTAPHTLLLDEPAVGMSPAETAVLATVVRRVRDELGVAVLVVEHNMHFMMTLAERITVLSAGRVLAEGTPAEVRSNADVIASYLGS
jgi:branched-chain amino acid transport system ATP-binding protein